MKHSLIKQTIIETASKLFYEKGYNLTGINEIIREAGIAKATLYSHFKSKDDICIAYLGFRNDSFLKEIEAFCSKKKKGKKQLLALFDFLEAFYNNQDFNGCWCINTVSEIPKENVTIRTTIQNQKKEFLELIEKLTIFNFPNKTNPDHQKLAKRIYLLYEGAISESHIHQAVWPIQSAKELCEIILK